FEYRKVGVEPLGGEKRAARGTGHAHYAADPQPLRLADQLGKVLALLCVLFALEHLFQLLGLQRLGVARAREDFGDQAAARVGDEMDRAVLRQRAGERERVLDRARAQRAMVERIHPAAVVREKLLYALRMLRPELLEGPLGRGEGAVDEDEDRI